MRRLRHRLLQRLVALLLVVGVGAGAVPAASAETGTRTERSLDVSALAAARAAAAQAPTRDAAISSAATVDPTMSSPWARANARMRALARSSPSRNLAR